MKRSFRREVEKLFEGQGDTQSAGVITEADLAGLLDLSSVIYTIRM